MTEREQLELAAKALGLKHTIYPKATSTGIFTDDAVWWNPLTDQADSDRMACKLRIDLEFDGDYIGAWHGAMQSVNIQHDNTDEGVCRAVREARMLVAVEIGRGVK